MDCLFAKTAFTPFNRCFQIKLLSYVNLLYLNIETSFFKRFTLLFFSDSALEKIVDNLKSRHLEKVIADHFCDKRSQLAISSHLYDLPFATLTNIGDDGLIIFLFLYLLLLPTHQQSICDYSEIKYETSLKLVRCIICIILLRILKFRILWL